MRINTIDPEQLLVIVFVLTLAWLFLGTIVDIFVVLAGGRKRSRFLPRWLRATTVSLVALLSLPRSAHAEGSRNTSTSKLDDQNHGGGISPMLAGSLVANAGFATIHVRRQLVRLRRTRFGDKSMPQSFDHETQPIKASNEFPDWRIVVRVLGPPTVETANGQSVTFEKGKSLELIAWMVEHRENSTRSAARTALWDGDVKDATFSNVVSEARRALQTSQPLQDDEWIPRTFCDELPLHPGVISDAQLLDLALGAFDRDRNSGRQRLVNELSRVRNLPFSGANYGWADGEGITTSHVISVVRAAVALAEYAIECDDSGLLFMATERGLRVLPGHEELVSLRMKGHARSGNRSAIKFEWESYARAIEADSWAGAEPSPELEQLARELSKA